MDYKFLTKKVKANVIEFFDQQRLYQPAFHNLGYIKHVVKVSGKISKPYHLNKEQKFTLTSALWLAFIGYSLDPISPIEKSVANASTILRDLGISKSLLDKINANILSLQSAAEPIGLEQQLMNDSAFGYLGEKGFLDKIKLLEKENSGDGHDTPLESWREKLLGLLNSQNFNTATAQELFEKKKQRNLKKLVSYWKKMEPKKSGKREVLDLDTEDKMADRIKEKHFADKSVETMFRISTGNNQRLSKMADDKAHILIVVNSIIVSAIISILFRKLETNSYLIVPTVLLLSVGMLSIIFSILATSPNLPSGKFDNQEVESKSVNLLFFGNFYRMDLKSYTDGMLQLVTDKVFIYDSIIKDIYFQGIVLGKKYRLLRIAYLVFMYGLTLAIIAFILSLLLFN